MALPLYLAMTAEEMATANSLPPLGAAMTCHFSLYGKGLEGLPESLPEGWMLVLNDRVPIWRHDPEEVANQLTALSPAAVLLDFQQTEKDLPFLRALLESLPYPVAVSQCWGQELDCPIFLEPVPPSRSLQAHLAPWKGRQVWLDISSWGEKITITGNGSATTSLPAFSTEGIRHREEKLYCHYNIQVFDDRVEFTLYRTIEDIAAFFVEAEGMGVMRAVGLWAELNDMTSPSP